MNRSAQTYDATRPPRAWRAAIAHLVALACICAMVALAAFDVRGDSPTEDEWAHLTRGIAFWQEKDTRLSYAHPPLSNMLAGWFARPTSKHRLSESRHWRTANAGATAVEYLRKDYRTARQQLMSARRFHVALTAALALYVYLWMHHVFGSVAALAALVLVAFNPTLIGQSRYVATDFPMALAATVATGELIRFLRGGRFAALTCAASLALCAVTKHSGAPFACMLLAVVFVVAVLGAGRYAQSSPVRRLLHAAGFAAASLVLMVAAIGACYRFQDVGLTVSEILAKPEPQYLVSAQFRQRLMEQHSLLVHLPSHLKIPLPYTYLFGLSCMKALNAQGFETWFMGEVYWHGKPQYFPIMLGIKTPPAVLGLLALGALSLLFARPRPRFDLATLVLSAVLAMVMAALVGAGLNMGVRHALLAIPLMSLLAGAAFSFAWRRTQRVALQAGLALALATPCVEALAIAPRYLGYFNGLVGGEASGHRVSAFGEDWGQDRAAFVAFVKRNHWEPIYYDIQTATRKLEVDYLRLRYRPLACRGRVPPPGSLAAIHRLSLTRGIRCFPWVKGLKPIANFREHVLVFRVPPRTGTPPALPLVTPGAPDTQAPRDDDEYDE